MYSVLVHVTIQPQHVDEFISLNREFASASLREEPGTRMASPKMLPECKTFPAMSSSEHGADTAWQSTSQCGRGHREVLCRVAQHPCTESLERCGSTPIPLSNQREHF